jgi:acyl-CoA synthetase (AMP-forming)/AMP-acid ligase II
MSAAHRLLSNRTVVHHLLRHALEQPTRTALTFLRDGEEVDSTLTFAGLAAEAAAMGKRLADAGLAGQRVMIFHHPGREFVTAFLGCLWAGAIAVPLAPPVSRRLLERARLVIADCQAAGIATGEAHRQAVSSLAVDGVALVMGDGLQAADGVPPRIIDPEAPVFLQYTSGSTGDPKGVMISQANLIAESQAIGAAYRDDQDTVTVSWLPLLHDMGLIGSLIHPLHFGSPGVHMTPNAMIRRPRRWMEAVHRFRGGLSGGPDFAWRMLADALEKDPPAGLDLSCLTRAYSGSEQIRPTTVERITRILAPTGFRPESFLPVYGMAEATLLVTGGPSGEHWTQSRPNAAPDGPAYMACGQPQPAGSVAIVDPDAEVPVADGTVGEVWITGAHVAAGYWNRPEISERTFRNRLPGDPHTWLRSGDLGFLRGGQLHITGRIKDLLIVNGRKHHPEDLEASVQVHVPGCQGGSAAAFQTDGDQRLVLAVEMADRPTTPEQLAELRSKINVIAWTRHELRVDEVLAVRTGRLPRTTSGKIQRRESRLQYAAGRLGGEAR